MIKRGILVIFLIISAFSCSKQDIMIENFESGSLQNWQLKGQNPFYNGGPVSEDTIKTWNYAPVGYQGKYMLATGNHEGRHGNNRDGSIISKPFRISRNYMNFYLAGELYPRVRIYLLINNEIVRQAFGNNFYDLQLRGWDVAEFRGKQAQIGIEDITSGPSLLRVDNIYLSDTPAPAVVNWVKIPDRERSPLVSVGEFKHIFDSNIVNKNWQIFNSSLVYGHNKKWRLYAAAAPVEAVANPQEIKYIVLAEAPSLNAEKWDFKGVVLYADDNTQDTFTWQPFVIYTNKTYYMYYVGSGKTWSGWQDCPAGKQMPWGGEKCGDQGPYSIYCATSKDGLAWTRNGQVITDSPFAFTPYIHRVKDEWIMYYAGAEPATISGKHAIVYSTSKDLLHWSGRKIALIDRENGVTPWPEHSFIMQPQVFSRGNTWYMLAGPINNNNLSRYHCMHLFSSDNPYHWDIAGDNKRIFAEGGSIVRDTDGAWYITHNNAMSGGAWLAPLYWNDTLGKWNSSLAPAGK